MGSVCYCESPLSYANGSLCGITDTSEQGHDNTDSSVEAFGWSMYRFTPPTQAGRPFVEHSPHPEPTSDKIRYRTLGKRLQRLSKYIIWCWLTIQTDGDGIGL